MLKSPARLISGFHRCDQTTPTLMDLHWLPYPQRIEYTLCAIKFEFLRGSAFAYRADYFTSPFEVPC